MVVSAQRSSRSHSLPRLCGRIGTYGRTTDWTGCRFVACVIVARSGMDMPAYSRKLPRTCDYHVPCIECMSDVFPARLLPWQLLAPDVPWVAESCPNGQDMCDLWAV